MVNAQEENEEMVEVFLALLSDKCLKNDPPCAE